MFNVSRVINADTIAVGDTLMRLDGILAAERGHETYTTGKWCVAEMMCEASIKSEMAIKMERT